VPSMAWYWSLQALSGGWSSGKLAVDEETRLKNAPGAQVFCSILLTERVQACVRPLERHM
jgi:hypothetical protein